MVKKFCFVVCSNFIDAPGYLSSYPVGVFLSSQSAIQFLMKQKSNANHFYSFFKVFLDETSAD